MDPLRRDDIERARATPPDEKLRQALQLMQTGIRLKRAGLKARHPAATPDEIEKMIGDWLSGER